MSLATSELHEAFLRPFGGRVVRASDSSKKPLSVDLAPPLPRCLRVYMYNLVGGRPTVRGAEYKAVLRVPGQRVGEYGAFDHGDGRLALVVGYAENLDVFVLWDASLHPRFKNGGNIQVKAATVLNAAALGRSRQNRMLRLANTQETVLACRGDALAEVIHERVLLTGGGR